MKALFWKGISKEYLMNLLNTLKHLSNTMVTTLKKKGVTAILSDNMVL